MTDLDYDYITDTKKPPRRRNTLSAGRIIRVILMILLILIIAGTITAAAYIYQAVRKAPDISQMTVAPTEEATYIYNQNGEKTLKLTLPESNRDLVTIDKIPADLQHAFVAIEDSRFYHHNGVDIRGILRAIVKGITSGSFSEGASTITQQLIKNTVFTDWTSEKTFLQRLDRKIQEQYLAIQLEKVEDKDHILQDYLNVINLGAGCYGVQAASYKYFGKDVSELTLSEDAVIAAITQNPSKYNPITHPEENAERREMVLDAMLKQGWITEDAYREALADDVYSRIQSNNLNDTNTDSSSVYSYYEDALIDQVLQDLQDVKGYTYKQAYKALYTGGLQIYSAQDDDVQKICDEEFADSSNFPEGTEVGIDYALTLSTPDGEILNYGSSDLQTWARTNIDSSFNLMCDTREEAEDICERFKNAMISEAEQELAKTGASEESAEGDTSSADSEEDTEASAESVSVLGERVTITPQPQASAVVIDQKTGYVKAIVGGRGHKDASLTLNRATSSTRQPGSTFKILAVYAPLLNEKTATLSTKFSNEETSYSDGTMVSNWDISDYTGEMTVREAITSSVNVIAVQAIRLVTPLKGYSYCKDFGISTMTASYSDDTGTYTDIVEALALGGLTKGVTCLELTGAYATIANGGKYIAPKFYTKVLDQNGEILLDNTSPASRSVISEEAAFLLTSAMEDVISDPAGTAYGTIKTGDVMLAGKSGTTSNYRDTWFAGYSPYYTLTVWGGYDNNEAMPSDEIYHQYSKILWNSIMTRLNEDKPAADFEVPSEIVKVSICRDSGELAVNGCDAYDEYFISGTQPFTSCHVHGKSQTSTAADGAGASTSSEAASGAGNSTSGTETAGSSDTSSAGNTTDPSGGITILSSDQYTVTAPQNSPNGTSSSTQAETSAADSASSTTQADSSAQNSTNSSTQSSAAAQNSTDSSTQSSTGTSTQTETSALSSTSSSAQSEAALQNSGGIAGGITIYSQDQYTLDPAGN